MIQESVYNYLLKYKWTSNFRPTPNYFKVSSQTTSTKRQSKRLIGNTKLNITELKN
jgi:hypothetical protein